MKKSDMVRGMLFGAEFFTELYKEVVKLGGNEELMFEKMKTGSGFAKETAKLIVNTKQLALKSLKLIADAISVVTEPFRKDSFFVMNGKVKLHFWDNFTSWVLPAIPDVIQAFEGRLRKTEFTRHMYDSDILSELGQPNPFSVGEFAAIAKELVSKQPNGESGTLLTNGYANIFYIKLDDVRVVAVSLYWNSAHREWHCNAYDLGTGGRWNDGHCVFSRS